MTRLLLLLALFGSPARGLRGTPCSPSPLASGGRGWVAVLLLAFTLTGCASLRMECAGEDGTAQHCSEATPATTTAEAPG